MPVMMSRMVWEDLGYPNPGKMQLSGKGRKESGLYFVSVYLLPTENQLQNSSTSIKTPNAASSSLAGLLNVYYLSICGYITNNIGELQHKRYFGFDISENVRCFNRF